MSFILDALKKSENDRQRHAGPGLAALPGGGDRGRSMFWPAAVAALVLVNVGVIGWFIGSRDDGPAPASLPASRPDLAPVTAAPARPAPTLTAPARPPPVERPVDAGPAPAAAAPPPARTVQGSGERRTVRSLASEASRPAPASQQPARSAPAPASTATATEAPSAPTPAPAPQPTPSVTGTSSYASNTSALPTANDLALAGQLDFEVPGVELHVFTPEIRRRFVYIDGRKYRQGERLPAGATVYEIVPDGVVLDYRGRRFLLPTD